MTGIQPLERIAPSKPARPGQVERREFASTSHGTQCLIGNFEVATGEVIAPTVQPTGTEGDLGTKGGRGVFASVATRRAFLTDSSHRIRFVFVPEHTSWLNQIEIRFGMLVRRVIKRGSFPSQEDLREKILAFIEYFDR